MALQGLQMSSGSSDVQIQIHIVREKPFLVGNLKYRHWHLLGLRQTESTACFPTRLADQCDMSEQRSRTRPKSVEPLSTVEVLI